jgi:hypothetical protein
VALPAALPFIICFIFALVRIITPESNFTHLAFLWLIPVAALRALSWSSQNDPILLLGVPLLWTAVVVGMGFFVQIVQNGWGLIVLPAIAGAIAVPLLGATSYWAFFSQYTVAGVFLLIVTMIPAGISMGISFFESKG